MEIRRAKKEDIKPIIAMWATDKNSIRLEKNEPELSPNYLEAFNTISEDANQYLMVIEDNGEVVGSLHLSIIQYLFRHARKVALLEAVIVKEVRRGHGIGEQLIQWAVAKSKERGACLIELTSNKNRDKAHSFYKKLGFAQSHEGFKLKLT
ncbi:GNAT family N-acetyltransferase [uncultured Arcticibacterium sp.]|uniref:GNAT family N-acetyltransferase n=1 Tax=uncultured Arcticibacterium sp. TaxID=2173042 RepID=UPI0030FBBCE2